MTFQAKRQVDFWVGGLLLMFLFPLVRLLGMALRRDHSLEHPRGCAVIKLVGAGSLFLALPSLQAIRREFPSGGFYLITTRSVKGLAESCDWFDECWIIDDSSLPRLIVSAARVLWNAARRADHVIDLEVHSRLTTAFSVLTSVRNRIGFVDDIVFWRRGFYTHTTWFNAHGPVYAFYDLLAQWFGIGQVDVTGFHARFRGDVHGVTLPADIQLPARYMAVGHGCSDFARERQLLPREWARVLHPVALLGCEVVFLGSAADAPLADAIIAELGAGRNLCGRLTLMQSARVIADAGRYYGIDSLLLHLARALGTETTSFWGPTDPTTRLRPSPAKERAAFARMPCAPCVHINELPPCQGRRACMAHAVNSVIDDRTPSEPCTTSAIGWRIQQDSPAARLVSVSYV